MTGVTMSIGADVTKFIDGFIPAHMLEDREARTRARMFMFSHTFGPILGGVIPGYLLFIDPSAKWKLLLLAASIFSFWGYPFALKYTGRYQLLCYTSIQNLLFAITWGCYFYGGLSSPFMPWLVTVPLLAFFYLRADAKSGAIVSAQILASMLAFTVAIEVYGLPHTIPLQNMAAIGVISIGSSAIYVSMMALYYAGILKSQKEFEDEARRHMETSNELRDAVDRAERAGAAKAEFLARTSHELRTPLNAVIGFSEVLLEETDPNEDPQGVDDLNKIHVAGKHLLGLVNAILDLSKIEAGRMEVFAESHSLTRILTSVTERANAVARKRGVEFRIAVDARADDIEMDAAKFEQILNLLIDNAVKYAGEGEVVVTARPARLASGESGVEIAVIDRGPGIDGMLLPTLFETFSEGQDIQHGQKGPGLGLPLARRLCRLMRGDLHVARTGSHGTEMSIELPRFFKIPALAA
jgi:signal transduction histidine kinase